MTDLQERLDVAQAYIDALLGHDPSTVHFHPRAVRYEAGIKTGFSGAHLRRSLRHGPQFRLLQRIHPARWRVSGDILVAEYLLEAGMGRVRLPPVLIVESFTVPEGDPRIHRIDVSFRRRPRVLQTEPENQGGPAS